MKFKDILRNSVSTTPLLVRRPEAAVMLGSIELLEELVASGWVKPVIHQHKLTLYSVRAIQDCVARLEAGETPSSMSESAGSK